MPFYQPEQIVAETCIEYVEYHPSLESTNSLAVELRDELRVRSPALVLTDEQTRGRGRGDNVWWSTAGALTCSVVLDADRHGPPPESRALTALAAGLAVRSLVSELVPQHEVLTKWPNDVLAGDRKICGILSEQHATHAGTVLIIGIGLNLNNSLESSPEDVRQRATSLFDLTGQSVDLTKTLIQLLIRLDRALEQLQQDPAGIARQCAEFNRLLGRQVRVETPAGLIEGECAGIADDGALLLAVAGTVHAIRAGTVLEYR